MNPLNCNGPGRPSTTNQRKKSFIEISAIKSRKKKGESDIAKPEAKKTKIK